VKAVVLDYPPYGPCDPEARAVAAAGGVLEVVPYDDFAAAPSPADVILNLGGWPLPRGILDRLEGTRCVVGYGVGIDMVDIERANELGIAIVRMPFANAVDVALHTLALVLACARRLLVLDRHVRAGGFDGPSLGPFHRLDERRLGLLAFGNIPRALVALARPLVGSISAYDPYIPAAEMREQGVEPSDLEPLLQRSDLLSVHLPATPETLGLLDETRLRLLPRGAVVVVTSRGGVYDPEALARLLEEGHVAAAGLDVFPVEPLPIDHPLRRAPNVLLTPHVAGHSEEFLRDAHEAAAAVIAAVARGETLPSVVDATARALSPASTGASR
jgi:D-3-phosphoglycerate dehydrogenase